MSSFVFLSYSVASAAASAAAATTVHAWRRRSTIPDEPRRRQGRRLGVAFKVFLIIDPHSQEGGQLLRFFGRSKATAISPCLHYVGFAILFFGNLDNPGGQRGPQYGISRKHNLAGTSSSPSYCNVVFCILDDLGWLLCCFQLLPGLLPLLLTKDDDAWRRRSIDP